MGGESRNMEEESLVFLYGEEVRSFLNENFEGSKQERQIFTEVFYGKNAHSTAKGFRDVGMVNYASDKNIQSMAMGRLNSKNPVPTCQPSLKDLYGRDHKGRFKETKLDGSRSSRLHKCSCGQLELGVCNPKSKHVTASSEGPPNSQRKERGCCLSDINNEFLLVNSSKDDSKCNMVDLNDMPPPTPYRIVESFSQGIISSCFFPSYSDAGDGPDYSVYDTPSRSNDSNDIIRNMKVGSEGKHNTALLTGDSSACKFLVGNGPNALTMNRGCKFFDTDVAEGSIAFVRELPHRLRLHAHNLLLDAGWKIEDKRRKDRDRHYSIFRTPGDGVPISSLINAWRICGECLDASDSSSSQQENSRQWLGIDGFWCDLAEALAYIEREVQHLHSNMSLLHRWHLLDPFVSVVCIDKKIRALREGKAVKFVKGRIVDLGSSRYLSLTEKSGLSSRKPAKFPSHSVSSSSHRPHPCKSSNISIPISSSMNDAVVDESILTVVKAEVTKTSHNKKRGCKNIPEVHMQVNHYPKGKEKNRYGGLHRKLSFDGEVSRRNVKNLAKSIGNRSNFDRRMPNMKHLGSLECSKQESTPMGATSSIRKGLILSSTAVEPDVPLSPSPQMSQSDLSEQDQKSTGAASTGIGVSDSYKVFPVENQPHEEADATHEGIKHETPRTRLVKVKRTSKKRKQQVVKPESASINLDKDQATGECKNDDDKCQMENDTSSEAASTSPLQHAKSKNYPTIGSKMPVVSCQNEQLVRPENENCTIEASIPSEGKSLQCQTNQKTAKRNNCESQKGICQKRQRKDDIDDDDLLIAVIINRDQNSNGTHSFSNAKKPQSKGCRNLKSRKGSCKLLLRTSGKCGVPPISGSRTPLGWLLNSGVVPLNAVIQCRSPKNNSISKDGRVTREGILCKCCGKIFSVSAFKYHAGCKLNQTSLNLFLESGRSYTLCQLQAWSDEYKARKDGRQVTEIEEMDQNDDTCGLCGDGGELICCDNCPSTFHQACVHSQVIPEGCWYCPNCTCKICGDAVAAEMPLDSFIMLECSQCEQKYHEICLIKRGSSNDRSVSDTWFCGEHCEKVYFGLRSRVGVTKPLAGGFSWAILRCNPSDQMVQSAQKIALMAECNSKLAVALTIMEECFLPMVDPRTGINLIPQVLYGWGSNFPRLNYHGFYTIILEKDDKIISVATIRVHGISLAEMPLIATCSEHRRQGMCRRLMGAIEEMLRSFKVQTVVLSAIPDIIDTWTSGFGFKPVNDDEKQQLRTINLMLFPGTTLLKKSLWEGFEMRKPEDETFSSSREDLSHAVGLCDTRNSQQPDSSLTAGVDQVVGTTSQEYANLEVSEKENCRQPNLPAFSSETLIIDANGAPDDVAVTVSGSDYSNALVTDLFSDVRSSVANKEFRDVEGATTGVLGITTCQKVMDDFHDKELIAPSEVDKISIIKITENCKGKSDGNILESIDRANLVAGIDDTSSIDVSAQWKELPSGSTARRIPSEVVCNATNFRVDSIGINGRGDGNSSTVVCINEISNHSVPVVDSTKDILDPVGPIAQM